MMSEHPTHNARDRAADQWSDEIRALAKASMRDDEYRAAAGKAFRVLRPIHTSK